MGAYSNAFSADFDSAPAVVPEPVYGDPLWLISLSQIKAILGITDADTTHDAAISKAAPVVTELFENYCKRGLAYATQVVEEFDIEKRLPLYRYPIKVIELYQIDGATQGDPAIEKVRGFVKTGVHGPNGQVASVTYTGGYPQDDVPVDLAEAYANCVKDYSGVTISGGSSGSTGSSAPLKSLSLGSGALSVAFETGSSSSSSVYDVSDAPSILQPYVYTLRRFMSVYV